MRATADILPSTREPNGLPAVEAVLTYIGKMAEKPFNYTYDPPPGQPRTNAVFEEHVLPIHDARPVAAELSLDQEGFALARRPSASSRLTKSGSFSAAFSAVFSLSTTAFGVPFGA